MSGDLQARVLYRLPVALRWRDLDAFNHVNNATFMTYLEEARIRWLDSLGGEWMNASVAPLLAAVQMNYRQPIAYPGEIAVELTCQRVGNSSLTIGHRIVAARDSREAGTDILHADGHVVMVWIDRGTGRPCSLPAVIRTSVES
ncbi:thioesterase family protein [Luteimonas vadosa]|uniref:Thioesterase family protein n=1 Tax=Luteimonas vadosa TaxID=1165507 RepID=A0ABP9E3T7_9GAMM